jgi:hypothetical protein
VLFELRIALDPLREFGHARGEFACAFAVTVGAQLLACRAKLLPVADEPLGPLDWVAPHLGLVVHGAHGGLTAPLGGFARQF